MTGHGLHHSDIGGYTTLLFDYETQQRVAKRWCDFSAFTPMMRTHEGNRPGDNWQFDGDAGNYCPLCPYLSTVFTTLKTVFSRRRRRKTRPPVCRSCVRYSCTTQNDAATYTLKYQYLLGQSAGRAGSRAGALRLDAVPAEDHAANIRPARSSPRRCIISGRDAPIGKPPVFYRAKSGFTFASLRNIYWRRLPAGNLRQMEKNNESNIIESGNPTLAAFKEKSLPYGLGI